MVDFCPTQQVQERRDRELALMENEERGGLTRVQLKLPNIQESRAERTRELTFMEKKKRGG